MKPNAMNPNRDLAVLTIALTLAVLALFAATITHNRTCGGCPVCAATTK